MYQEAGAHQEWWHTPFWQLRLIGTRMEAIRTPHPPHRAHSIADTIFLSILTVDLGAGGIHLKYCQYYCQYLRGKWAIFNINTYGGLNQSFGTALGPCSLNSRAECSRPLIFTTIGLKNTISTGIFGLCCVLHSYYELGKPSQRSGSSYEVIQAWDISM